MAKARDKSHSWPFLFRPRMTRRKLSRGGSGDDAVRRSAGRADVALHAAQGQFIVPQSGAVGLHLRAPRAKPPEIGAKLPAVQLGLLLELRNSAQSSLTVRADGVDQDGNPQHIWYYNMVGVPP